jgi:hypothetical protein
LRTGKYAPRDLQTSGKALWHRIFDSYTLDPAEEVLLHQLCRVTDNLDRIAADLSEMSINVAGSDQQPVVNKLLHEEREQIKVLDQLQRALALPVAGEPQGLAPQR